MFDRLKKAFSKAAKGISQKELTEEVLDDTLLDLQMALFESDVAQEVVEDLSARLKKELLGLRLEKEDEAAKKVQSKLQTAVAGIFARSGKIDLIERIASKKAAKAGPFIIVFLGINGTGKTTTVAKIANLLRKAGFTVVVAAGDTHRAGAIEQLEQHTNRLSLKIVKQRYGADPSSVGRDACDHAKKNFIDVVLVDTAGRMQTSKNLMDEMGKIVRVVKPDLKLFIGDALAGNDTINQAREFFQYTNFDGAILTKIDADAKGGSAISIAHITSKPVVYIGVGQGYDDIIPFDPDKFIGSLFGGIGEVSVESLKSIPKATEHIMEEEIKSEKTQEPEEKVREEEKLAVLSKPQVQSSGIPVSIFPPKREQKVEYVAPKPIVDQPEPPRVEEVKPKEKRGRFGFFSKKRTNDHRSKEVEEEEVKDEEEKKRRAKEEEEERVKLREEEEEESRAKKEEKLKEEKSQDESKDDKEQHGGQEDKTIYLTDEDIEDLLK